MVFIKNIGIKCKEFLLNPIIVLAAGVILLIAPVVSAKNPNVESSEQVNNVASPNTEPEPVIWYDDLHADISSSVVDAAKWFDEFFIEDLRQDSQAKALTRIRTEWAPRAGSFDEFSVKFRIKLKLPALENNYDLIIANLDDEDDERLPLQSGSGKDSGQGDLGVAIRVVHRDTDNRFFDSRIGIGSGTIYARTRSRRNWLVSDTFFLMTEPSLTYFADDGWQVKGIVQGEWKLSSDKILQLSTSAWINQADHFYRWKHGALTLRQLNDNAALLTGISVAGNNEFGNRVQNIKVSSRWRQQTHRSWLYVEIEPFIEFNRDRNFKDEFGVALRLEGAFGQY